MFTGITSQAGALVTAIVVLTGAATLCDGKATADPTQDDQFLAQLDKEEIPAVKNVPSVIAAGHNVCRKLDGGMPVDDMVDAMRNYMYDFDPFTRRHPTRVTSTVKRFITTAVQVYCPYDQNKVVSIMANPAPRPNESTHPVAAYAHRDDQPDRDAHSTVLTSRVGALPVGEIAPPNPPQIPAPQPPTAQIRTPPRTIAAPPPRQPPPSQQPLPPPPPEEKPPPPPEEKPPPPPEEKPPRSSEEKPPTPQQVGPPATAPEPGGAAGGGGTGRNGGSGIGGGGAGGDGGGQAGSSPRRRMPPGFVRLAP
ncbi:MAG: DUF732 domain-containing protein [Mycobacterium sp.]|nr:DUF732 domain-containing protein [Mycobacterium sp.]